MKTDETTNEEQAIAFNLPVMCRAYWKRINSQYGSSNGLFIGKILVAEYYFNGMRPKGDPKVYRVSSPIRGIKSELGNFELEEDCKARCIEVGRTFVKMLEHGT